MLKAVFGRATLVLLSPMGNSSYRENGELRIAGFSTSRNRAGRLYRIGSIATRRSPEAFSTARTFEIPFESAVPSTALVHASIAGPAPTSRSRHPLRPPEQFHLKFDNLVGCLQNQDRTIFDPG